MMQDAIETMREMLVIATIFFLCLILYNRPPPALDDATKEFLEERIKWHHQAIGRYWK